MYKTKLRNTLSKKKKKEMHYQHPRIHPLFCHMLFPDHNTHSPFPGKSWGYHPGFYSNNVLLFFTLKIYVTQLYS